MIKRIIAKRTIGMLCLLLAFIIALNVITPSLSDTIRQALLSKIESGDHVVGDYTLADVDLPVKTASEKKTAVQKAYEDGSILIYNYAQLSMIGSGESYTYDDGVTATYAADASYQLVRDIPLPRHTLWQLPEDFSGTITGQKQEDAPLYEKESDRIYLYHPYQLAVMAMDNADSQPVMDGDADAKTFGSGKVILTDEKAERYLTYSGSHNYVISSTFTSKVDEKPASVVDQKADIAQTAADVDKASTGVTDDGRDFPGQVIKTIDNKPYILIGNEDQLRAIGSGKAVYPAVYQADLSGTHYVLDHDSNGGTIMLYGGDADLDDTQNGSDDFAFQQINDANSYVTHVRYCVPVDQTTGQPDLNSAHTNINKAALATDAHYTDTANYIIFRDINLGGQPKPWTPLMFSGAMYGAKKSENDVKLWNGSGITDSTALTATTLDNRPVISNVYVNQSAPIEADKYIGIGFFATVTNEVNADNIGVSTGTVKVHNIELNQVEVHNTATTAKEANTIVSALTSSLGWLVGGLVDALTNLLSFGTVKLSLRDTLSAVLDARAKDPSIYSTGAFAGRVIGDVEIKDCAVTGSVSVENHKNNTGGFVGYSDGVTHYDGLSNALGGITDFLSSLLNVIPGLGLGDLITILLENGLPLKNLIPTGFYEPHILNCTVDGLTGDIGQIDTDNNGGFVGLQVGTQIEDCRIQNSDYTVYAESLGGGFSGVARDAEVKGTLNDLGVDVIDTNQIFSRINENLNNIGEFQTQSLLRNCAIEGSDITVTGGEFLGGFAGALAASYAIDCSITGNQDKTLTVEGTGNHVGGFFGEATLGWFNSIGKDAANQNDNSLLAVVRQLGTGLLSSSNEGQNQKLLSLVGLVPSAIMGCQINAGPVNVSGRQYVGGILGRGQGVYLTESSADYMNQLSFWSQENDHITNKTARDNELNNLASVTATGDFAGGVAGELETVNLAGVLDGTLSAGSFKSFTVSKVSVTGVDGGYDVKATGTAQDFDGDYAGGGFGRAYGGTIEEVTLHELNSVEAANNKAAGFIASAGPGDVLGSGGLTINLLGLNYLLNVKNLLSIGQNIHVKIADSSVTGVSNGFTVEAKGSGNTNPGYQYIASGFIAQSNSTEIENCHTDKLLSVKAASTQGYSGGFVGVSVTGGLADVSDVNGVKSLLSVEGSLLNAVEYLIPSYTNCTTTFVNGGYVDADIAGGFVADMESGTVDNSTIATVDDSDDPKWTKTMKELYDPRAVSATGDLQKQFAVFNIGTVYGRTYGGGFGGKLISGALADAGGGISILGDTELSINVSKLTNIMNAYIPVVKHAGVYSEDGFTVAANEVRADDPYSGSAGGFAGYTSGAQISHSDVYQLINTTVTPPSDLEAVNASSYFDSNQSTYAVVGGHYAGGYVGNMDIGSAASLGNGLKILGETISLTNVISALNVVVTTIEHSDVQGAGGGFSVIADGTDSDDGKVGMAGGFAGGIYGGHIQNSHCKNFYYIIGEETAGGYVGNMEPGNVANLLDDASILSSLIDVDSALASLVEDFVPSIRNSTTSCVPCGGAVRAHAASDASHQRGSAGGYCGHNEGGHIWGLNNNTWKDQNDGAVGSANFGHDTEGSYVGEKHIATAWRIRSVYGYEYAGGFTGYMEPADTAETGSIKLLGELIKLENVLSALSAVYPTEEHTAVYGPLRNLDVDTWNTWVQYVGRYGGYGAELAQNGITNSQIALDGKLSSYVYGCNVVAGRSTHETNLITEGGNAGGYAGYMVTGVITDGQSYDMKLIRAMRNAGGYAGKMQSGGAASFGSLSILNLNLNLGSLVKAAQVFVPTVKSGTIHGWQSGMTVECFGTDHTHQCGYAGGYAGSAYGAQIWGDENAGNSAGTGCNVTNLRYVRGTNATGGYFGMATAASVADVNTNSSDGILQGLLNRLISSPGNLASVMQATVTTVRQAAVNPDNDKFGFTVGGIGSTRPRYAGGFAGSLEAAVIGSRKGESDIIVNGLRSVYGLYYAGGFVGLADVGSVASVSGTGDQSTTILSLINAGSVDLLGVFRTYIYYSYVNGVADGMVIRAYESAPSGILSETRQSGCAGGFGGGIMDGTVVHSNVTKLNAVSAPNYVGGFIGHMGKNGAVKVDNASISQTLGLTAGVLNVFGTSVNECNVAGIDAGAVIRSSAGNEPISGGFAGYADDAQIKNSNVTNLKQVYSDQIAGGFVGKTNMSYAVSVEADSALVQVVLGVVNGLIRILQVNDLEDLDILNLDSGILGLKLLTDGDLLYVNLLGLRIGVSLVKQGDGKTGTAVITIGDSTIELPYNEDGIDTTGQNAEVVINLIKANRTRVDNCSVKGIDDGYDVFGGGASNSANGSHENGYAGGFVGYNNEGKFTSDTMEYCDVIRGTSQKVGTFSGGTRLESVYSFNTLESIEKVSGEENQYSVYRNTDSDHIISSGGQQIGAQGVTDGYYQRFDVTHLAAPIVPGTNEAYYKIFEKWNGAQYASNTSGGESALLNVYVSDAKADLMLDTPTYVNDDSLIPNPGVHQDPCDDIDLTIQKIWEDQNNIAGARPDEIKVRIWQHRDNADGTEGKVVFTDPAIVSDADQDGWFTISKAEHERADSATWTRVIEGLPVYTKENDSTYYYSYTVEEAEVNGYIGEISYDETGDTATATIVNTLKLDIEFKYYDRYMINGIPAGIESEETTYSVSLKTLSNGFNTYDKYHKVSSINFSGLIGSKAVEFSNSALSVTNVMCDYDLWTSQSAAVEAMSKRTYFVGGVEVSYGSDTTCHTDYLGKPNTHSGYNGNDESRDEKWVSYYDVDGKELQESFKEAADYLKVSKIIVWCYNYPRLYDVNIYGADSADDLVPQTVGGSQVYVANAESSDNAVKHLNDRFYYNQRFGGETGDTALDAGGFIEKYGLPRYTDVKPADYAKESFGEYTFAYWAYDQEGTQIASVDRDFWYRVANHTKLYAVYATADSAKPGISISANANDTYVDTDGVSKTRLNILGSVYGAEDYDKGVEKISFANIALSAQIRNNPELYTPDKINALFEQYKDQLKDIIEAYDRENGSKSFSTAHPYVGDIDPETGKVDASLSLTLTTKGYIYTITSNGNEAAPGDKTASLTNKNRVQFTTTYKTSALNVNGTGANGDTCLMYCAALKYQGEWSVSTNCLIYRNGEVVKNTVDSWNSGV